jgi:hypothetical protein
MQIVNLAGRTVTNNGTLIELQRVSQLVHAGCTNIVWRQFFVSVPGQTPCWGADIANGISSNNLFFLLSSGTSFVILKINTRGTPEPVPQQIKADKIHLVDDSGNHHPAIYPPPEFFTEDVFAVSSSLRTEGDNIIVSISEADKKQRDYRYSLGERKWTGVGDLKTKIRP